VLSESQKKKKHATRRRKAPDTLCPRANRTIYCDETFKLAPCSGTVIHVPEDDVVLAAQDRILRKRLMALLQAAHRKSMIA
jgi:hypothetical protein